MPNDYKLNNPTYTNCRRKVSYITYPHWCITNYIDAKIVLGRNNIGNKYKRNYNSKIGKNHFGCGFNCNKEP